MSKVPVLCLLLLAALAAPAHAVAPEEFFPATAPHGAMLVVHGGGWSGVGQEHLDAIAPQARFFAAHGYDTYSMDYRPGADSLTDVRARFVRLKRHYHRVCLYGVSAGGQLAMMAAILEHGAACVIAAAAPTDLPTLAESLSSSQSFLLAQAAFGTRLKRNSPLHHRWPRRTRLLLLYARGDPMVAADQGIRMHAHVRRSRLLLLLGDGPVWFVHSGIAVAGADRIGRSLLRFIR
jgi:acetyl esterase/lipase